MLIPAYRPQIIRGKTHCEGGGSGLQEPWMYYKSGDMFKAAATDNRHINVDEYAKFISAYIQKCMEDVSIAKSITIWANVNL